MPGIILLLLMITSFNCSGSHGIQVAEAGGHSSNRLRKFHHYYRKEKIHARDDKHFNNKNNQNRNNFKNKKRRSLKSSKSEKRNKSSSHLHHHDPADEESQSVSASESVSISESASEDMEVAPLSVNPTSSPTVISSVSPTITSSVEELSSSMSSSSTSSLSGSFEEEELSAAPSMMLVTQNPSESITNIPSKSPTRKPVVMESVAPTAVVTEGKCICVFGRVCHDDIGWICLLAVSTNNFVCLRFR